MGDTEFYDLAQIIDARDYASQVLGFRPPKAHVQAGLLAQALTVFGAEAYTPCLYATKAPVSVVNALTGIIPAGDLFEFLATTDIVLGRSVRASRDTPVHEYGHFFFCTLLADTHMEAFNLVWSQVISFQNLSASATTEVKALNEGFADWFASQVTGSTNYFDAPGGSTEVTNGHRFIRSSAPALGLGLEANIGGGRCPPGSDSNVITGCFGPSGFTATGDVVAPVTTLLHDAIDRGACGTDAACLSQKRSAAAPWNVNAAPFAAVDSTLHHIGDEVIAASPKDITQAVRDFANANWALGTGLSYLNFYGALGDRLMKLGYSYSEVCQLFRLHNTDLGGCPQVNLRWTPLFGPPGRWFKVESTALDGRYRPLLFVVV